jgi:hypothetical protein
MVHPRRLKRTCLGNTLGLGGRPQQRSICDVAVHLIGIDDSIFSSRASLYTRTYVAIDR